MQKGKWWHWQRRQGTTTLIASVAAGAVAIMLVVFGLQLHSSQADLRDRVIARFEDRAQVISALTQAVFSSATATPETVRRYGAEKVGTRDMDAGLSEAGLVYGVLLDGKGSLIAASSGLTAEGVERARKTAAPALAPGAPSITLADLGGGSSREDGTVALTMQLNTATGRRVLVGGLPVALVGKFLTSYLQKVPTRDGTAYVVDSRGRVVAARDEAGATGRPLAAPGLLRAVDGDAGNGEYGEDGYFVSVPVASSTWRVVLTSSEGALFSSVTGARKWVPWGIYIALGLVAVGFLFLLRRLLRNAAALRAANERLEEGNARLASSNKLLRHAAELARSNAELEQFASIASHDLQEPLRKVQTFAAHLAVNEEPRLSEEGKDFLRRMNSAAGRMRALIDDLLMFSRVSTKGRPFVPVDLGEVVADVLVDLEVSVEEAGAEVIVAPDLPTVAADPMQMRQLLQNLIGNALKFRRPDVTAQVRIDAHVDGGIAELKVRDNGTGFDDQYATRIFRAFERLHGASSYPGTGIGLALCRKIVERHHGTITAEGEVDAGATFIVRLPVEQSEDGGAPSTSLFPEISNEEPHVLAQR